MPWLAIFRSHVRLFAAAALAAAPALLGAQTKLSKPEQRMRDYIRRSREDQVAFLGRVVNIGSGTMNLAGVRQVGDAFRAALDSLGFQTRWVAMPDAVGRAGHLLAEHRGKPGTTRILLIGHLDTVFEGPGQQFERLDDSTARGAGSGDMKGGDAIILYALKALRGAGALADANIIVALTGDEESAGDPLSVSRGDLIEAAKRSDVALAFEGGSRDNATVARRGASTWLLTVTGRQSHSAGVFGEGAGYGAIYEASRVLDEFRRALAGQQYLTFNPGVIVGGTDVSYDSARVSGSAAGKSNIVASKATVFGDLRFISEEQKERTRARMREIAAKSLPGTAATISFQDEYPAMSPTPGNYRLLAAYDSASQALGWGKVEALDPGRRGAGDVSFVAPLIDGLDGLGALGSGSHSPREQVNLNALTMQTERAAVLIYRLSRQKAPPKREVVGAGK
ncbi:MAG TPA: M20/M25/M40 family metallo-hydrolase [Gemmatimonadaceae bacterium]|nr:M20/M25/M40 family metallo-hydrolase [Gemmatimonadaceae bacterium]